MLNIYIDKLNLNVYNLKLEVDNMTISDQIKVLCVRSGISLAELARRLNTSPQSFSGKLKRESFTISDLNEIAKVSGATFDYNFVLSDGDTIK